MLTAVRHDVSDRDRAERELVFARQQAALANRAKDEFLANMSHELRTPLTAILGFAEILENQTFGALGSPKYLEYARDIQVSGQHLLALIDDMLDLATTVSGNAVLEETEIALDLLIEEALGRVADIAAAAGVGLAADIPDSLPRLRGDQGRILQVLLNLLSNAIKFTPEGGRVKIAAGVGSDGAIAIDISDNGIGIAEEHMVKVFTPFGQVEETLTRRCQGSGLGLPITDAYVRLHGGELTMCSRQGEGTKVVIVFPPERTIHPDHPMPRRAPAQHDARGRNPSP